MLETHEDVVRALLTYTDCWQPLTGSVVVEVGAPGRRRGDGLRTALLDDLDERTELGRRLAQLDPLDRRILFLFYVVYATGVEVADEVGLSERQCYRRRNQAVNALVDLADPIGTW